VLTGLIRPPAFAPLPARATPFVGREILLARASRQLEQRRIVALTGAAGSGKTALAAALLAEHGPHVHWISIAPGLNDDLAAFLWDLATPLATLAPPIWEMLHRIEQEGWSYPPLVRLELILDGYAQSQRTVLIGIDNLEHIAAPGLESLVTGMGDYVARTARTQLQLVVVGRRLPYRIRPFALPPLAALSPEAVAAWLHERAPDLTAEARATIVRRAAGVPAVIAMALDAAAAGETEQLPVAVHDAAHWLIDDLWRALPPDARRLALELAARTDPHAPIAAAALPALQSLQQAHLAHVSAAEGISIHPLLRAFVQQYPLGG
jgi:hypothetical protein